MCWTHGRVIPDAGAHGSLHSRNPQPGRAPRPGARTAVARTRSGSADGARRRPLVRRELLRAAAPRHHRGESAHRRHRGGADRDRCPGGVRAGADPARPARGRPGPTTARGGLVRPDRVLPPGDGRGSHRPVADRGHPADRADLRRGPGRGAVRGDPGGSGRARPDRRRRHVRRTARRAVRTAGRRGAVRARRLADRVLGERAAHGRDGDTAAPPPPPAAQAGRHGHDPVHRAAALHAGPAARGAPAPPHGRPSARSPWPPTACS